MGRFARRIGKRRELEYKIREGMVMTEKAVDIVFQLFLIELFIIVNILLIGLVLMKFGVI